MWKKTMSGNWISPTGEFIYRKENKWYRRGSSYRYQNPVTAAKAADRELKDGDRSPSFDVWTNGHGTFRVVGPEQDPPDSFRWELLGRFFSPTIARQYAEQMELNDF